MALIRPIPTTGGTAIVSNWQTITGSQSGGSGGTITFTLNNTSQYEAIIFNATRLPGTVTVTGATLQNTASSNGILKNITADTITIRCSPDTMSGNPTMYYCGVNVE